MDLLENAINKVAAIKNTKSMSNWAYSKADAVMSRNLSCKKLQVQIEI